MRVSLDDTDNDEYGVILYNDEPLTGTLVEELSDGKVIGEVEYVNGIKDGTERVYRLNGQLEIERVYRVGQLTELKHYHPNGKLARYTKFDLGEKTEEHVWDENGSEV